MPHFWNDILVVTADELVPSFYSSENSLAVTVCRHEKRGYGLRRIQTGGNGRHLLIDFDSLPNNIKEQFKDPRRFRHILEQFYRHDDDALAFYEKYQFGDGSYLRDEHIQKYTTNASVLRACGDLKIAREQERLKKGFSIRGVMETIVKDAHSFNPILEETYGITHSLPQNDRRFVDAFKRFFEEGYPSLISRKHKNDNARVVTDYTTELLNSMFASDASKPTTTEVSRRYDAFLGGYIEVINEETGELYDPKSFRKLSTSTINNYLRTWQHAVKTAPARTGNRQVLMARYIPHHTMEQPTYAGSIISVDDRQPPFEYAKGKRMWWYNGIDLASEAFTVWVYGKSKEGIILDFYRQMVRNYYEWGVSLPAEIEAESSLNSSFTDTFLKEGIMFDYVRIEANNARGKRIERYFGNLRYDIEKQHTGWLARPFAMSESNQESNLKVPMVDYDALVEQCLRDIEQWNNTEHSKIKGKTRWEVFVENQNPTLKPINLKRILPMLGYMTETSVKAGIIKLQRGEYLLGDNNEIYFGEKLINLMKQVEGEKVNIYWLDGNDGQIIKALVYQGDRFICEAISKPTYNRARAEQTPTDLANREAMSKYVSTIEAYMRNGAKTIDKVTLIDNRQHTLNNKFKINGITRPHTEGNIDPVDILPDAPDFWENTDDNSEYTYSRNLKDRF